MRSNCGREMWAALLCLTTLIFTLGVPLTAAQTTIAQQIAVPAYFPPGSLWTQLDNSVPYVGVAVANIINGPDYQAYSNYASSIQNAHNAGIKVLGYVDTGYFGTTGNTTRLGNTDTTSWVSQIESDVDAWYNFYGASGLDGIFFDEMQNVCGTNNAYANLYADIQNYVKQNHLGAMVAANPGIAVPQCYQNAADILLTFEGTYLCYTQDSSCPTGQQYAGLNWNPVDPQKVWHLIYNTSQSQLANASSLSKQRNAGYFFVTAGTLPNPWNTLPSTSGNPSYWGSEEADAPSGGTPDNTTPTAPDTLDTVNVGATWAILNWGASTDSGGSGVVGYNVYESGTKIVSVPAGASFPQVTINGLLPSTQYSFTAKARNAAGTASAASNTLQFTTDIADGSVTAPGSLTSSSVTYTSANLSWNASSGCCNYAVAYYDVYQNGTKVLTLDANVTSVTVIGLTPGSTYTYTVKARDTQGDVSPSSNSVNVTASSLPGGVAITNPTGSYTSTTLTYTANYLLPFALRHVFIDSDNNSSTGYQITWTSPPIGVDYMIENSILYQYAGTGTNWAWTSIGTITPSVNSYTVTWQVPLSDFSNPATTQQVLYEGDGFNPTGYSSVISLAKH